jgi:hypothetical protein
MYLKQKTESCKIVRKGFDGENENVAKNGW